MQMKMTWIYKNITIIPDYNEDRECIDLSIYVSIYWSDQKGFLFILLISMFYSLFMYSVCITYRVHYLFYCLFKVEILCKHWNELETRLSDRKCLVFDNKCLSDSSHRYLLTRGWYQTYLDHPLIKVKAVVW